MATSEHADHPRRPPRSRSSRPATDELQPQRQPELAELELLDHRVRSRAIPSEHARPGRYLAFRARDGERLVALESPVTHIGSGFTSDLRIDDPHISRHHALITGLDGTARLLDDRSDTGTLLNGQSVQAAELHDGDTITLGPVTVRYVELPPANMPADAHLTDPTSHQEPAMHHDQPHRPLTTDEERRRRDRRYARALDGWLATRIRTRARQRRAARRDMRPG
jgi:FHA domain